MLGNKAAATQSLRGIVLGFAAAGVLTFACLASPESHATDLRGRIQGKAPQGMTIELRSPKSPQAALRKTVADREGRYYIADIPPGRYELFVNGRTFTIAVEQVAIQELPPILLTS